jgi:hypothetical protein
MLRLEGFAFSVWEKYQQQDCKNKSIILSPKKNSIAVYTI